MPAKHLQEYGPMSYERASHLLNPLRKLILSPKKMVRRLDLKKDARVLELGCGPGYFSLEVARNVAAGKLVMVDIQQEMLDMAKNRLEKKAVANVEYIQGDAVALPLESESFDVVFLVAVLGEVPDRVQCLRELHRVLRPKGLLSVTEQFGDPHAIPMSQIHSFVKTMGFEVEKSFGGGRNFTVNFRKS
jgi:ubiquinone/menaquinone biosynthesis C-methylase UbiE